MLVAQMASTSQNSRGESRISDEFGGFEISSQYSPKTGAQTWTFDPPERVEQTDDLANQIKSMVSPYHRPDPLQHIGSRTPNNTTRDIDMSSNHNMDNQWSPHKPRTTTNTDDPRSQTSKSHKHHKFKEDRTDQKKSHKSGQREPSIPKLSSSNPLQGLNSRESTDNLKRKAERDSNSEVPPKRTYTAADTAEHLPTGAEKVVHRSESVSSDKSDTNWSHRRSSDKKKSSKPEKSSGHSSSGSSSSRKTKHKLHGADSSSESKPSAHKHRRIQNDKSSKSRTDERDQNSSKSNETTKSKPNLPPILQPSSSNKNVEDILKETLKPYSKLSAIPQTPVKVEKPFYTYPPVSQSSTVPHSAMDHTTIEDENDNTQDQSADSSSSSSSSSNSESSNSSSSSSDEEDEPPLKKQSTPSSHVKLLTILSPKTTPTQSVAEPSPAPPQSWKLNNFMQMAPNSHKSSTGSTNVISNAATIPVKKEQAKRGPGRPRKSEKPKNVGDPTYKPTVSVPATKERKPKETSKGPGRPRKVKQPSPHQHSPRLSSSDDSPSQLQPIIKQPRPTNAFTAAVSAIAASPEKHEEDDDVDVMVDSPPIVAARPNPTLIKPAASVAPMFSHAVAEKPKPSRPVAPRLAPAVEPISPAEDKPPSLDPLDAIKSILVSISFHKIKEVPGRIKKEPMLCPTDLLKPEPATRNGPAIAHVDHFKIIKKERSPGVLPTITPDIPPTPKLSFKPPHDYRHYDGLAREAKKRAYEPTTSKAVKELLLVESFIYFLAEALVLEYEKAHTIRFLHTMPEYIKAIQRDLSLETGLDKELRKNEYIAHKCTQVLCYYTVSYFNHKLYKLQKSEADKLRDHLDDALKDANKGVSPKQASSMTPSLTYKSNRASPGSPDPSPSPTNSQASDSGGRSVNPVTPPSVVTVPVGVYRDVAKYMELTSNLTKSHENWQSATMNRCLPECITFFESLEKELDIHLAMHTDPKAYLSLVHAGIARLKDSLRMNKPPNS